MFNMVTDKYFMSEFAELIASHFDQKLHQLVLDDFRAIFAIREFKKTFKYYRLARSSYGSLKKIDDYKNYWASLSSPLMLSATYLSNDLIEGKVSKSNLIQRFDHLVHECFNNDVIVQSLIESFDCIVDSALHKVLQKTNDVYSSKHDLYIIPSGYGWSGSGAILDYLKEFSNTTLIMGEEKIIEGDVSFKYFCRNIDNNDLVFKHAVKFFFINILGYYVIYDNNYYKPLCDARNRIEKCKNILEYSQLVRKISFSLSRIITYTKLSDRQLYLYSLKQELKNLSKALLDLITVDITSDKIPVLNNIIHTYNLDILEYLDDVKVVCSLRDPRSIYISKSQESVGFKRDPSVFVSSQKEVRNKIKKFINHADYNLKNYSFVSFEDFVLKPNVREDLAKDLGLNLNNHQFANQYFDPSVSIKNVNNFKIYTEYKKEIDFIYENLKEFCINDSCEQS